jgi:FixJ family two-component response regulator
MTPMPANRGLVHFVDDDPAMLHALTRLPSAEDFAVCAFLSSPGFLAGFTATEPICLVLDVALPELGGPSLQKILIDRGRTVPIIFLTGHGDAPLSVRTIEAGTVDFLCKPVGNTTLLAAGQSALKQARSPATEQTDSGKLWRRFAQLSDREREVMGHVVTIKINKQIAAKLGTVLQTIKVHHLRVMQKTGVTSVAELIRAGDRLGLGRGV